MKADDLAGLEALVYWTHLFDRVRRKTDVRLFVSNEYLSCRFGCIIEPTGFIMNKHTHTYQCVPGGHRRHDRRGRGKPHYQEGTMEQWRMDWTGGRTKEELFCDGDRWHQEKVEDLCGRLHS